MFFKPALSPFKFVSENFVFWGLRPFYLNSKDFNDNFAAIELVARSSRNTWFVAFYSDSQVSDDIFFFILHAQNPAGRVLKIISYSNPLQLTVFWCFVLRRIALCCVIPFSNMSYIFPLRMDCFHFKNFAKYVLISLRSNHIYCYAHFTRLWFRLFVMLFSFNASNWDLIGISEKQKLLFDSEYLCCAVI